MNFRIILNYNLMRKNIIKIDSNVNISLTLKAPSKF
jgi:hypothetical protein